MNQVCWCFWYPLLRTGKVLVYREFFYHLKESLKESNIIWDTSAWIRKFFWVFSIVPKLKKVYWTLQFSCEASSLSNNLKINILFFRRLYKTFFIRNKCFNLFIHPGKILVVTVIVSCGIKFSKMFIFVSLKTETCLFTLRLERLFSQSNNSIGCLVRSIFAYW